MTACRWPQQGHLTHQDAVSEALKLESWSRGVVELIRRGDCVSLNNNNNTKKPRF